MLYPGSLVAGFFGKWVIPSSKLFAEIRVALGFEMPLDINYYTNDLTKMDPITLTTVMDCFDDYMHKKPDGISERYKSAPYFTNPDIIGRIKIYSQHHASKRRAELLKQINICAFIQSLWHKSLL